MFYWKIFCEFSVLFTCDLHFCIFGESEIFGEILELNRDETSATNENHKHKFPLNGPHQHSAAPVPGRLFLATLNRKNPFPNSAITVAAIFLRPNFQRRHCSPARRVHFPIICIATSTLATELSRLNSSQHILPH